MNNIIIYKFKSGKPFKFLYNIKKFLQLAIPSLLFSRKTKDVLTKAMIHPDYDYIMERVNYYNRTNKPWHISTKAHLEYGDGFMLYRGQLKNYKMNLFHSAYYFDQHDITCWFPGSLYWSFCPGDVYFTPQEPTIVKSRLLTNNNQNAIVLKLDKLRHFIFVHDIIPFRDKQNKVIFRGKIRSSRLRKHFLELFFDHPTFDCGIVEKRSDTPCEWVMPKKTIKEHLEYKFIMALEGNDVASNLKWVMSSNSIAVMTKPTCETWFMEGTLIPDFHYIEINDDFSNLEEKVQYYIDNPDKAEAIIGNAHNFIDQFQNKKREELIGILVLDKYFKTSNQYN